MSFDRYIKMQFPTVTLFSGVAFLVCDEITAGILLVVAGIVSYATFRKEMVELMKLVDNDEEPK